MLVFEGAASCYPMTFGGTFRAARGNPRVVRARADRILGGRYDFPERVARSGRHLERRYTEPSLAAFRDRAVAVTLLAKGAVTAGAHRDVEGHLSSLPTEPTKRTLFSEGRNAPTT